MGGGSIKISFENLLSHGAEKFHRGTLIVSLVSGFEKSFASEGYVMLLFRNFLYDSAGKIS